MASDAARALECKKRGGEMFAKGKIAAAIEAYSEAICFAPREAVYYTNRAVLHIFELALGVHRQRRR